MAASRCTAAIEIPDDEESAGQLCRRPSTTANEGAVKKRGVDEDVSEKIHWTDDSDVVPAKPKSRRGKRKSSAKRKSVGATEEGGDAEDDLDLTNVPEYLQQRRREFDENRARLHESALMLPPDYTGIDIEDSRGIANFDERPKFEEGRGARPSRPYQDIELPQSGGLIPAPVAQYLREYQVSGVKFLHRMFVFQTGGILGDDMGLGKTVQVVAFLTAAFGKSGDERDDKRMRQIRFCSGRWYPRILIICPGSLILNWKNEFNQWGWWHVDLFHGTNKDDVLDTARAGLLEIMITTYETYKNNRSSINMVQWDAVIADECHRVKDPYSETTKAMKEVNALCRIGLTGTAIQNRYEELWTLLDWTNPGYFGSISEWKRSVSKPLAVGQSHEATVAQLSLARQTAKKLVDNLLPRFFLRRMKSLIADQLPKKTDRVVFCPLTDLQRDAYENFIQSPEMVVLREVALDCEHGNRKGWCCQTHLPSGVPWQSAVFPSMIVLQKLANHLTLLVPTTTDNQQRHTSDLNTLQLCMPDKWKQFYAQRDQIRNLVNPEFCGKWKVLRKLLRFWHGDGNKVLVFSHSVRLLRILQHLFTNTSYSVSYLDGSLSYEERQDIVDTFNSDPTQFVFLISTKAGGVGLNITSANKVVIVDPHWNPSWDLQAQDRAYRIGQTRDVEVFRLIALGTVEEIVYARQIYKQQQANIGYTASSERRYFKGVQQDQERRGEIFGLSNIFSFHPDCGLLREIVNKTNIAEAKAGVHLIDVDMEKAAQDAELQHLSNNEAPGEDDGGMSQLAAVLTSRTPQGALESDKRAVPHSDAVQAILASAGVEYTHENSEIVGSSKIEEQLSRRAVLASHADNQFAVQNALFTCDQIQMHPDTIHSVYKPPEEVRLRQFCEMAKHFGFANAAEFALVVEGWTQEERRNCLDAFYKRRAAILAGTRAKEHDQSSMASRDLSTDGVKAEAAVKDPEQEMPVTIEDGAVGERATRAAVNFGEKNSPDQQALGLAKKEEDERGKQPRPDKIDDGERRTSIFLSGDEDDDEL